jgi:hypothetical protein
MNCPFVLVQRMDAVPAELGEEHLSPLPLLHHPLHPLVHPPGRSLNLSLTSCLQVHSLAVISTAFYDYLLCPMVYPQISFRHYLHVSS